jgi:hypothetical protein
MNSSTKLTGAQVEFVKEDQKLATIVFGITLGFVFATASKAITQTFLILPRKNRNGIIYLILVWGTLLMSFIGSILL